MQKKDKRLREGDDNMFIIFHTWSPNSHQMKHALVGSGKSQRKPPVDEEWSQLDGPWLTREPMELEMGVDSIGSL